MNTHRLRYDELDPAFSQFLWELSVDTAIDQHGFAEWLHEHRWTLRDRFKATGEASEHHDIENCLGIFLRVEYIAELKRRAPTVDSVRDAAGRQS